MAQTEPSLKRRFQAQLRFCYLVLTMFRSY